MRHEVLLDGVPVAVLTDRAWEDMFWRSYRIAPVGDPAAITDDTLWDQCRFTFRDPASGMVARSFAGGQRPFVKDGRVRLRVLLFAPAAPLPRATAR